MSDTKSENTPTSNVTPGPIRVIDNKAIRQANREQVQQSKERTKKKAKKQAAKAKARASRQKQDDLKYARAYIRKQNERDKPLQNSVVSPEFAAQLRNRLPAFVPEPEEETIEVTESVIQDPLANPEE